MRYKLVLSILVVFLVTVVSGSHGGLGYIDMRLESDATSLNPGEEIIVELVLVGATESHDSEYSTVDAVVTWDPSEAEFVGYESFGDWYDSGLPDDIIENTINEDTNDGAFYYTAWAQNADPKSLSHGESVKIAEFVFKPKKESMKVTLAEGENALDNYGFSSRILDNNGISVIREIEEIIIGNIGSTIQNQVSEESNEITPREELQIDALALIWFFVFTLIALFVVALILHVQNRLKTEEDELPSIS